MNQKRSQRSIFTWSGQNLRVDTIVGPQRKVQIISNGYLTSYSQGAPQAMRFKPPQPPQPFIVSSQANVTRLKKTFKKSKGGIMVTGVKCDLYERKLPNTTEQAWIPASPDIPVIMKSAVKGPSGSRGSVVTALKLNKTVPPSAFTLPKGVVIKDVNLAEMHAMPRSARPPMTPPAKPGKSKM